MADDLDAKVNSVARALGLAAGGDLFTDRIRPLDGRMFYKGLSPAPPGDDEPAGVA